MKLRKSLLSCVLFFILYSAKSQEGLFEVIQNQTCDCLTKKRSEGNVSYADHKNCVKTTLENNLSLIFNEVLSKYPDSLSYKKGYEYGENIGRRLDTALVYSCDAYFLVADSLRFTFINKYNKDSASQLYLKYKEGNYSKNPRFYNEKAKVDFITRHYQECLVDIEEASHDLTYKNSLLVLKGLALDKVQKFTEAATVFYQFASLSKEKSYLVHAAIENRKSKLNK
jgi:hypothetical protein